MRFTRFLLSVPVSVTLAVLAGCGSDGGVTSVSSGPVAGGCSAGVGSASPSICPTRIAVAGVALTGKVFAGQQPVTGAAVQLYAAGNSGNGSAPTALLGAALTTDATGAFSLPAGYSCPSAQTPVYLLASGGKPGAATVANPALRLMTALGPCANPDAGASAVVKSDDGCSGLGACAFPRQRRQCRRKLHEYSWSQQRLCDRE